MLHTPTSCLARLRPLQVREHRAGTMVLGWEAQMKMRDAVREMIRHEQQS